MLDKSLGKCERCGGRIMPVTCREDDWTLVIANGECHNCGKRIVTDTMTIREFLQRDFSNC